MDLFDMWEPLSWSIDAKVNKIRHSPVSHGKVEDTAWFKLCQEYYNLMKQKNLTEKIVPWDEFKDKLVAKGLTNPTTQARCGEVFKNAASRYKLGLGPRMLGHPVLARTTPSQKETLSVCFSATKNVHEKHKRWVVDNKKKGRDQADESIGPLDLSEILPLKFW